LAVKPGHIEPTPSSLERARIVLASIASFYTNFRIRIDEESNVLTARRISCILSLWCNSIDVKLSTVIIGISTAATLALVVGCIPIPSIIAQTTAPPPTNTSHVSTNVTLDTILGAPFFEDRGSKVTGTRAQYQSCPDRRFLCCKCDN
jgi:hypothetical protein